MRRVAILLAVGLLGGAALFYIGLEFSDVYTALGSDVTFIEVLRVVQLLVRCCTFLGHQPDEIRQALQPAVLPCSVWADPSGLGPHDMPLHGRRRCQI